MIRGLTKEEVIKSKEKYGDNTLSTVEVESLFSKILGGLKDPMVIILCIAALLNTIFVVMGHAEWYEVAGILVAVALATGVGAVAERKNEKAMLLQQEELLAGEKITVVRDGAYECVLVTDIVKGDIVYLNSGDKIPADGVLRESKGLEVNQASLNGETAEALKVVGGEFDSRDLLSASSLYRGTYVVGGEGYMEVIAVGQNTIFGGMMAELQEDTRDTPLKVKLADLAGKISKFGYIAAVVILALGLFKVANMLIGGASTWVEITQVLIDTIAMGVVIIVMAVPEGLPMMISFVLALFMQKMCQNNVLVLKSQGIETAGSLSILFTDKTGTLTEGKLTVTELVTPKNVYTRDNIGNIAEKLRYDLVMSVGVNNSAHYGSAGEVLGGNSTDRAVLEILDCSWLKGVAEVTDRELFNSTNKYSSVTVGGVKYLKGAPEVLLTKCTHQIGEDGNIEPIELEAIEEVLVTAANQAYRCLGLMKEEDGKGVFLGVLKIRDNARKEVTVAIKNAQSAGVQVVMVTGDRKETAVAIATEVGLYTQEDVVLTSDELAFMTDAEVAEILPRLRVVARAIPSDKSRLVKIAQDAGHVVGMTGDGVNDSPALKKADVGFAMGSGTEVAKAAGDIVILDDNFTSIVRAILYGRTIFQNIRKFLRFQLSINVGTVIICALLPIFGLENPFSVITILYINIVMDTLASIALGNEPTMDKYMLDAPIPREASVITREMFIHFMLNGVVTALIGVYLMLVLPSKGFAVNEIHSMVLIMFMFINIVVATLSRVDAVGKNKIYTGVMLLVMGLLWVLVEVLGRYVGLAPLTFVQWLLALSFGVVAPFILQIKKGILQIQEKKGVKVVDSTI